MTSGTSRRDLLKQAAYGGWLVATADFAGSVHAAGAKHSIAQTGAGKVRGVRERGVHVFKGVSYGADTATRRFLPPVAVNPWQGVRDAFDYGPACPQLDAKEPVSEDCLSLNVWTPALHDGGKRPVMVYIHGGEYSTGSGSSPLYDGTHLCLRGDVVVVTVNHRLNAFGHLYLGRLAGADYAASGNAGLLDLVLALNWVRDHAMEFGGDQQRVMLFGQSGGGAKIATLLAMPSARGLFHRAATMSGQQITASGPRGASQRAEAYLRALQITGSDLARLRSLDVAALVAATRTDDPSLIGRSLYFGPVLDAGALPRHPFYPDAPPLAANIPMIIGNTRDETRAFHGSDPGIFELGWSELPERLLRALHVDIDPDYVVAEYRRMYPQYTPTEVFFAATTAGRSWRGAVIEAELRAQQGAPVYAYELDYRSPLDGGRYGAMHTMDIPLVFDNISQPGSLTGTDASAQKVADRMSDAFIAFARNGDPNHTGLPQWRPYELSARSTMLFDAECKLADDPRGGERRLFAQVPYIQRGTYLAWPVTRHFGERWLQGSWVTTRFIKPAYHGETISMTDSETDGNGLAVECRNAADVLLATLECTIESTQPPADVHEHFSGATDPQARVEITWDTVQVDEPFATFRWQPDDALNREYAARVDDETELFRKGVLHPHAILSQANQVLVRRFVMPAWIHTGSEVRFRRLLRVGEEIEVRAVPLDKWERKGHQFIKLYVAYVVRGELATEIFHTAIFRVATR